MRNNFDSYSSCYHQAVKHPVKDHFVQDYGYFHRRKAELLRTTFPRLGLSAHDLSWLDIGCGKGDLLRLVSAQFRSASGCDLSGEMIRDLGLGDIRRQWSPVKLPFEDALFGFATAVCVYHHVAPGQRRALTADAFRVLGPGGVFCLIEHNPWNPITQFIVHQTPLDEGVHLLSVWETRRLLRAAGFTVLRTDSFLFFPEWLYTAAPWMEKCLRSVMAGGQYAVWGQKPLGR